MREEFLKSVFEPFAQERNDGAGGGTGLGLAIAKSFAELQHGSLKISTEADLFKADLYLPKSKEMPEKPGGGYPENL